MQAIGQLTGGIAHRLQQPADRHPGQPGDDSREAGRRPRRCRRGSTVPQALRNAAPPSPRSCSPSRASKPLAPAPIDLTTIVPELMPLMQRTLGAHIDVRYVETAGLWPAMADHAQLESAVLNLALNARDGHAGRRPADHRGGQQGARRGVCERPSRGDARRLRHARGVRHRPRHEPGGGGARVRAVLHHQAGRQGHRPRARHGVRLRQAVGAAT